MALDGREVNNILSPKILGDGDTLRINLVQNMHLRLRCVLDPPDVALFEIVQHRNGVAPEDGHVVIKIFALKGVGHHGLVLDANKVSVTCILQCENGPLHLPWGRVRRREREMPRDIVLQDRGGALLQGLLHTGELHQVLDILQNGLGTRFEYGDGRFAHRFSVRK